MLLASHLGFEYEFEFFRFQNTGIGLVTDI